jgi:hypothetical protein
MTFVIILLVINTIGIGFLIYKALNFVKKHDTETVMFKTGVSYMDAKHESAINIDDESGPMKVEEDQQ